MKTDLPTIDVIMPSYNGLPYLKEAIQSVLDQTYANLVLYVIEDGSDDGTEAYIKTLSDKRIKYSRKPNGGSSSARNYGIKQAKSDYIAFLDSDDIWYPNKLARQFEVMQKDPRIAMVYGWHDVIDEEGKIIRTLEISNRGRIFDKLLDGNRIAGSNSMVLLRRSALDDVGYFREDFVMGEDWELFMRIADKYLIDFVPDHIAAIRELATSVQRSHVPAAESLVYIYPIIVKEFGLNSWQRARVAVACLWFAAIFYLQANERTKARQTLLRMFSANPIALFYIRRWLTYARVLFGNKLLRNLRASLKGNR